jgi:hypothetical protein
MLLGDLIESKRKVANYCRVKPNGDVIYETSGASKGTIAKYDYYSIFTFEHNGMSIAVTYYTTASTTLRIIRKEPFALLAEGKLEDYRYLQIEKIY